MTRLPDFLGIGAQRSGSTWLYRQLESHPDIYVPMYRKELRFFNHDYERGLEWYRGFFADRDTESRAGEVTPSYFEIPQTAERIHRHLPDCQLILILRNPVDRAFSAFTRGFKDRAETRSFEEYLAETPRAVSRGLYAEQLRHYLRYFDRTRVCVLQFEKAVSGSGEELSRLADFLGVDPAGFAGAESGRHNASYRIAFPAVFVRLRRMGKWLRKRGLDRPVEVVKATGVPKFFERESGLPTLSESQRSAFWAVYADDVRELEALTGLDLSDWRP